MVEPAWRYDGCQKGMLMKLGAHEQLGASKLQWHKQTVDELLVDEGQARQFEDLQQGLDGEWHFSWNERLTATSEDEVGLRKD